MYLTFDIKEDELNDGFLEEFEQLFFARATSFWLQAEHMSAKEAEEKLIQQSLKIFKEVNK